MATRIDIGTSYGTRIVNLDSFKYNGLYYRHAEIKGKRMYCRLSPILQYEDPFEEITEFYVESGFGSSSNKEENTHVSIGVKLSSNLQNEIKRCFGGTVYGRNYAKPPQFDSLKSDKGSYSFSVFVNNPEAEPYQYEYADFCISFGDLLSGIDSDISRITIEGTFSNKLNDNFAQLTLTPSLLCGGCLLMDEAKFPTMTLTMSTKTKSGSYASNDDSIYCNGRGNGTIKVYDDSGNLLHSVSLSNDIFYVGGAAPYIYGIALYVNGSNICYYQTANYRIEFDIEYWNGDSEVSLS